MCSLAGLERLLQSPDHQARSSREHFHLRHQLVANEGTGGRHGQHEQFYRETNLVDE
jgi:hypothetical protein